MKLGVLELLVPRLQKQEHKKRRELSLALEIGHRGTQDHLQVALLMSYKMSVRDEYFHFPVFCMASTQKASTFPKGKMEETLSSNAFVRMN